MSNLIAFNSLVRRAVTKADNSISLLENMPITTNCGIVLFADKHIRMLEEQLAAAQSELAELRKLRDEASRKTVSTGNHPSVK